MGRSSGAVGVNWKVPTWKGLIGLLAFGAGAVTSVVNSNVLPAHTNAVLLSTGGVLLAVERVADAMDFKNSTPGHPAEMTVPEMEQALLAATNAIVQIRATASRAAGLTATTN